jgi:acrylyl-CoA reductase (NADPH)
VRVEYSSFNYKDGLALKGKNRILRSYPIIPGIDFAGTVLRSTSEGFRPGERVVLTGWGVGEGWSGGFAIWTSAEPCGLMAMGSMSTRLR